VTEKPTGITGAARETDGAIQQLPGTRKMRGDYVWQSRRPLMMIRRFVLLMVVLAAGAATAIYWAGHGGPAGALIAVQWAPTIPSPEPTPAPQLVPHGSSPVPRRPVRVIPILRPESETTGGPAAGEEAHAAERPVATKQPQCDRRACSRAYQSFDAATCSYQPSRGGPRRLCKK
jgi:hypothetical protein